MPPLHWLLLCMFTYIRTYARMCMYVGITYVCLFVHVCVCVYVRTHVQASAHHAACGKGSADSRQAGRSVTHTRNCTSEQRCIETQTSDKFRRNSCACGNSSSPAPYFRLFQWLVSARYRSAHPPVARMARALVRLWQSLGYGKTIMGSNPRTDNSFFSFTKSRDRLWSTSAGTGVR